MSGPMASYKKLLLATDFSEASRNALAHAVELAGRKHAELHILHVEKLHVGLEGESFPAREEFEAAIRDSARKALADLEIPTNIKVTRESISGVSVSSVILDYASEHDADLIVTGSHGRAGLSRWFLGSVAQEVVRRSPVPVLITGVGTAHAVAQSHTPKVLVPVDFSDASKAALLAAKAIAAERKAQLLVIHAIDVMRLPPYFTKDFEAARRKHIQESMSELVAASALPKETEQIICEGAADQRIVENARDHGVQLIVMGVAGHGIVDRLLVGSVTERVLRSAPCPVLAYRQSPPKD